MAAPATTEELPHPGSCRARNLDHRGLAVGCFSKASNYYLSLCGWTGAGKKLSAWHSLTLKIGFVQRLWHPLDQVTVYPSRSQYTQVRLPTVHLSTVISRLLLTSISVRPEFTHKYDNLDWGHGSVVEQSPSMKEALDFIHNSEWVWRGGGPLNVTSRQYKGKDQKEQSKHATENSGLHLSRDL